MQARRYGDLPFSMHEVLVGLHGVSSNWDDAAPLHTGFFASASEEFSEEEEEEEEEDPESAEGRDALGLATSVTEADSKEPRSRRPCAILPGLGAAFRRHLGESGGDSSSSSSGSVNAETEGEVREEEKDQENRNRRAVGDGGTREERGGRESGRGWRGSGASSESISQSSVREFASMTELFVESKPSVVHIETFKEEKDPFTSEKVLQPRGTGSGFLYDRKGHIVTNWHVVKGAEKAQVKLTLQDDTQAIFNATLTGADPDKDIAVLHINSTEPTDPLPLSRNMRPKTAAERRQTPIPSSDLRPVPSITADSPPATRTGGLPGQVVAVGQRVAAIGNPHGLEHTLTVGVVSGLQREIGQPDGPPIQNCIQTDAAINPGNSGGPLLDCMGRLVGINTAIRRDAGGIGFSVHAEDVSRSVESIISTKGMAVERARLGLALMTAEGSRHVGVNKGLLVLHVGEGTEAERLGIKGTRRSKTGQVELGDALVSFDGLPVDNEAHLSLLLEERKQGDVVRLTLLRPATEDEGEQEKVDLQVPLVSSLRPELREMGRDRNVKEEKTLGRSLFEGLEEGEGSEATE
uniref:PDZ domain-containing protein n=1 Tax=Chromera velia CCMP2878 TaxID=1169474 RepID=A0A0G4IFU5_9ALVE|eukprot:Cvel_2488.t1-p1 / transcript=Cvel_2488.t1 / gene=Cvel_2488 / organism=Chromera_velia_CCMP2878 / gene_product=Protease Do-like 1, chloroplastic, putative / transcript_product=Protease Do-like 1, chloroplastic, putative / location=Cvel_scaffold98:1939-5853(-) / protein_length=578 / sequence_SO=supercontig / SO=protein_coding / is_pseudo=false